MFIKGLIFNVREGTTDSQVVKEVIEKDCYQKKGMTIESGETWLDLGANIGTFSVLAASKGAKVIAYEPEPENYEILKNNLELNGLFAITVNEAVSTFNGYSKLYLGATEYQKYTHTLRPTNRRKPINVKVRNLSEILENVDCIKMDIEGAEIEILEQIELRVKKLVFEYSFNQDTSVERYNKIINKLKVNYHVFHKSFKDEFMTHFPSGTLVYCKVIN